MNYPTNERNQVLRTKQRAHYDEQTVHAILDAGLLCHVGICTHEQPFVIPMAYARDGNTIILHGALNSRLCKALETGVPACVTVTHLDGLVLARATFHHSMNYRSAVIFGTAKLIENTQEKAAALELLVDFLAPGRNRNARPANKKELNATSVLALEIEQASAKIREGGPNDIESDLERNVWAGVIPITQIKGEWQAAEDLKADIPLPEYSKAT